MVNNPQAPSSATPRRPTVSATRPEETLMKRRHLLAGIGAAIAAPLARPTIAQPAKARQRASPSMIALTVVWGSRNEQFVQVNFELSHQ